MIGSKARLSSKGQLTIPIELRRALKLKKGAILTIELREDGMLVRKAPSAMDLIGIAPELAKIPWKQARRMAWQKRAERLVRSSATRTS